MQYLSKYLHSFLWVRKSFQIHKNPCPRTQTQADIVFYTPSFGDYNVFL